MLKLEKFNALFFLPVPDAVHAQVKGRWVRRGFCHTECGTRTGDSYAGAYVQFCSVPGALRAQVAAKLNLWFCSFCLSADGSACAMGRDTSFVPRVKKEANKHAGATPHVPAPSNCADDYRRLLARRFDGGANLYVAANAG